MGGFIGVPDTSKLPCTELLPDEKVDMVDAQGRKLAIGAFQGHQEPTERGIRLPEMRCQLEMIPVRSMVNLQGLLGLAILELVDLAIADVVVCIG